MRYLVTGTAGFIGFHLATSLANEGHQVLGIDSFTDYYSADLKRMRAENLLSEAGVETHELDLANKAELKSFLRNKEIDSVFHLAAQPGVRLLPNQYSRYHDSNIVAFVNILEAALDRRIGNFIYASSSSVYGNTQSLLHSETENDLQPISYYGTTKLVNEMLASKFAANSTIRARGLRFFTVYGSWGRPDMAYLRLISACLNGKVFNLYGSKETFRDFTYVEDVVEMVSLLNQELMQHAPGFSDVVNVGGGRPETLSNMMRIIEIETGNELRTQNFEKNENDVVKTFADSTYLEALVGIKPQTTINNGLPEVVKWAMSASVMKHLDTWVNSSS